MNPDAYPVPWGLGDVVTLLIAMVFFTIECLFNWHILKRQDEDGTELLGSLMASGLTVGPMAMILADPLNKIFGLIDADLIGVVMHDARTTLWFACFLALMNTMANLFRPRD